MNATSNQATTSQASTSPLGNPWVQLIIGIICMACVANLQYGWTLFVNPIDAKYHWGRAAIQVAFTIFVLIETWLVPVEGYLVDRFGPRWVVLGGGVLVGIAWVMNSGASSLLGAVHRGGDRRYRHRVRLWHLRRQRAQVVPGPARNRGGAHGVRIRRRRGAHHRADLQDDRLRRLRAGVPGVRTHPGRHRVRFVLAAARAAAATRWPWR